MKTTLIIAITAFILGLVAYHLLFRPEITETTVTVTETVVDTTYQKLYLNLKAEVDDYETLNDSIEYYQKLYQKELGNIKLVSDTVFKDKPFEAPLRRFTGLQVHLYGLTRYNALVAGNLLDLDINSEFDLPKVTNTIYTTTTNTRTIEPKGRLFVGVSASQKLDWAGSASYVAKDWSFDYSYQLEEGIHWAGIKRRVF
jgi:hypothetical protein